MSSKSLKMREIMMMGLWKENPVFVQLLGMCPTLAVTNSAAGALGMGLSTTFVLFFSSFFVSSLKNLIPKQVRIASYMIIISTFVTIVDYFLQAKFPDLYDSIGPYIPLIVVNCLILGRQESFSSKHSVFKSLIDAVGMGVGFTFSLFVLGAIRELLGVGTILGKSIFGANYEMMVVMILPAGAFLTLGILIGLKNQFFPAK